MMPVPAKYSLEIRGDMRGMSPFPCLESQAVPFLRPSDGTMQISSVGKSDDYHYDSRLPSPQLIRGDAGCCAGRGYIIVVPVRASVILREVFRNSAVSDSQNQSFPWPLNDA